LVPVIRAEGIETVNIGTLPLYLVHG
jgi:hypothetical protein